MEFNQRKERISGIVNNYIEEVSGLRGSGIGYKIGFGILLLFLLPVLLLEILLVLLFGKDIGVFVLITPVEPPKLIEEEVPESLRDLIPLASKFGISDDADRGEIMKAASPNELADLEGKVLPRQQEILEWLDTFPETKISDTASFFLYLGSACDEVPLFNRKKET
jgi:hypothetical protein